MKLFDLHLDAANADRNAFDNLTFFGVSGALMLPPTSVTRGGARAASLILDRHLARCRLLAKGCGATLVAAAAVRLDRASPRNFDEALATVAKLAAAGQIGAIAPVDIGALSTELARAHLSIAAEADLPLLLYAGPGRSPTVVRTGVSLALRAGVQPSRLAVGGLDHIALRPVLDCGALAVLGVGRGGLVPADVVDVAVRFDRDAWPHLALGSLAGGGALDVLSLARAGEALASAPLPVGAAAAICWRNAHRWLGLAAAPSALAISELR